MIVRMRDGHTRHIDLDDARRLRRFCMQKTGGASLGQRL